MNFSGSIYELLGSSVRARSVQGKGYYFTVQAFGYLRVILTPAVYSRLVEILHLALYDPELVLVSPIGRRRRYHPKLHELFVVIFTFLNRSDLYSIQYLVLFPALFERQRNGVSWSQTTPARAIKKEETKHQLRNTWKALNTHSHDITAQQQHSPRPPPSDCERKKVNPQPNFPQHFLTPRHQSLLQYVFQQKCVDETEISNIKKGHRHPPLYEKNGLPGGEGGYYLAVSQHLLHR